ncbi:hypothetical protein N7520_002527 [Penicillium odoratum]|uniref:uncharacterized protein n=1 Tax=Penicillium odoratum TaxID=1167516 RepID=UPI00254663F5|nr:uncharacterized protein N7520_002527 [Penicillium odoratum]KAJ5771998.1 hypothetical protein N7520_002527 [Penicillium odoratum]
MPPFVFELMGVVPAPLMMAARLDFLVTPRIRKRIRKRRHTEDPLMVYESQINTSFELAISTTLALFRSAADK